MPSNRTRNGLRAIAAGLCLVLAAGCSLVRVGYGHLDTFALWTADEYFDLDPRQKDQFRARFERLHEWHRYEQLPDYARFLASASTRIQRGLKPEDAEWVIGGVEERYRSLVNRSTDDAAAMLMTISSSQLEALQRKWRKENARFRREQKLDGTPEEQREARLDRELKRIEEWVGHLSREQEQKIAALAKAVPVAPRLRYEDRLRRQREFLQLMAQRGDERQFAGRLRHFLINWEEGRSAEYGRFFSEWRQKQADFYLAVERLLTQEQRATLLRRIQRYTDDFTRLAQREGSSAGSSQNAPCPGCPRHSRAEPGPAQ